MVNGFNFSRNINTDGYYRLTRFYGFFFYAHIKRQQPKKASESANHRFTAADPADETSQKTLTILFRLLNQ